MKRVTIVLVGITVVFVSVSLMIYQVLSVGNSRNGAQLALRSWQIFDLVEIGDVTYRPMMGQSGYYEINGMLRDHSSFDLVSERISRVKGYNFVKSSQSCRSNSGDFGIWIKMAGDRNVRIEVSE